jgi:hypothetical protein
MTTSYIPAPHDLGPDPEPLPPRFDGLLARHVDEARRPVGAVVRLEGFPVSAVAPDITAPALAA